MEAGWSEDELAKHYCRDIRTIRHYLKMADWSEDVKNLLRENPKIFSTRVIMRSFAYKKFGSPLELKNSIQQYTMPKAKIAGKERSKLSVSVAGPRSDKKAVKSALTTYLSKQKLLSKVIKEEITKAFIELKLI